MALVVSSTTPAIWRDPASIPRSRMGDENVDEAAAAIIKDEQGSDINCVVCSDKSSGKHYGQYTCEGRATLINLSLLGIEMPEIPLLFKAARAFSRDQCDAT